MIDSKALEHAAQRSYEYEGDRKGCSYVGWAREPEDVKAEWRASVRTAVLAYLATSPAAEIAGTVGDGAKHGPYRVKWIGAGVWAGITDELPAELEGKDVWLSTATGTEGGLG